MPYENNKIYQLRNLGLPELLTLEDLAKETRLSFPLIQRLTFAANYLYKVYSLPKKSGGNRLIAQPNRELKAIQGWILRNILDKLSSSEHSKGFDKKQSILHNASPHVGATFVLSMDIEDFFPSIKASKVYNIFHSVGYNPKISSALTKLCTYQGTLPQGAPTSPKLANLVSRKLDIRIFGYCGSKGIIYTRYADDLTFSSATVNKLVRARDFIQVIVKSEGLKLNNKKTKLIGTRGQKKVTGLIISQDNVGIGRESLRKIRAKIHNFFSNESSQYTVNEVNGWLSYIFSVDKKYYRKLKNYVENLKMKYPSCKQAERLRINIR